MERNRWDKKRGWFISFFLLLLSVYIFTGISEAGVTLKPRYNGTNIDAAREQYVYFGKYEHRLGSATGTSEDIPTPILWRVMELKDHGAGKKGAILLSHYLLESMAYQGNYTHDGGSGKYYRTGTSILAHTWDGSEVQSWLNSSDVSVSVKLGKTNNYSTPIKGFLHPDYFSSVEQGSMLDYPYNRYSEGEIGPAAGKKIVLPSGGNVGTIQYEMGTWFASANNNENNNTRKAHFKGGPESFTAGNFDGWYYYWTRSPASSFGAYGVDIDGRVGGSGVGYAGVAVRPALFLNLESIIFKSASDDFDLGLNSAAEGGSRQNPYLLVLPSESPNGAPGGWTTTFTSAIKPPKGAKINGKELIVSWDVAISPAVKNWPASGDFKLGTGEHPTNVTSDDSNPNSLKLTFATSAAYGAAVTLSYNLNTDAISYDSIATPVKVVDSFANFVVSNDTPSGGGGETTPTSVGVTLGGKPYNAQRQPDGTTYLITLPSGTDLKAIKINMTLPAGATISPDLSKPFDFASEGTKKFTITAEDKTTKKEITITITAPTEPPTEKAVLAVNASDCEVLYATDKEGKITVEIRIPFASGVTPADLESLMLALKNSGLSNIKFAYVNADGTVTPYSSGARAAATKAPYLRITGTAPSVASLANEAVTSLSYKTKGSATQYVQTFPDGGLKLSAMDATDNTKKESGNSSSGGCNTGAGSAALLAMGIVVLGLNKAGVRKKK